MPHLHHSVHKTFWEVLLLCFQTIGSQDVLLVGTECIVSVLSIVIAISAIWSFVIMALKIWSWFDPINLSQYIPLLDHPKEKASLKNTQLNASEWKIEHCQIFHKKSGQKKITVPCFLIGIKGHTHTPATKYLRFENFTINSPCIIDHMTRSSLGEAGSVKLRWWPQACHQNHNFYYTCHSFKEEHDFNCVVIAAILTFLNTLKMTLDRAERSCVRFNLPIIQQHSEFLLFAEMFGQWHFLAIRGS